MRLRINSTDRTKCPKLHYCVEPNKPSPEIWERGGSVVECRTPEREVGGSKPTAAVLCPWARHFTPRKYWLITQEVVAPSRHNWKIVDWDVKHQHKQTNSGKCKFWNLCVFGFQSSITWQQLISLENPENLNTISNWVWEIGLFKFRYFQIWSFERKMFIFS